MAIGVHHHQHLHHHLHYLHHHLGNIFIENLLFTNRNKNGEQQFTDCNLIPLLIYLPDSLISM